MKSYVAAEQRIVAHLVDGTPLSTESDQAHVRDVLEAFAAWGWPGEEGLAFARPNPRQEKLTVNEVEISLKPSLLISNTKGHSGACKFFYNKPPKDDEPQLPDSIGKMMAALLYYYGVEFLGDATYKPSLCQIVCVRDAEVYATTGKYKRLLDDVAAACGEIKLHWSAV